MDVMKNYYEENKNIFKLVEKREALFKTMEEFEVLLTLCAQLSRACKSVTPSLVRAEKFKI